MSVAEIWQKLQSRMASERELDSLDAAQREELARDVGVPRGLFERLFRTERNDELERLMYALAIDTRGIAPANRGAVMRDMSIVCSGCALVSRCRRELDSGSAQRNYDQYCPNALSLNALRAEQSRWRHS